MTSTTDIAYLNYDTNDGSPGDIFNRNGAHYLPLQVDYFENQQQHQDQQRLLQTLPQVPYTYEEFVNKLWKRTFETIRLVPFWFFTTKRQILYISSFSILLFTSCRR